jgi:hypothetical protein
MIELASRSRKSCIAGPCFLLVVVVTKSARDLKIEEEARGAVVQLDEEEKRKVKERPKKQSAIVLTNMM